MTSWCSISSCPVDGDRRTHEGDGAESCGRGLDAHCDKSPSPAPLHNTPAWPWRQTWALDDNRKQIPHAPLKRPRVIPKKTLESAW